MHGTYTLFLKRIFVHVLGSEHTMPASKQATERSPLKNKNWNPWRALIAYWIFGLCNNYGYVVMLSAAHDIIKDLEDSVRPHYFTLLLTKLYISNKYRV